MELDTVQVAVILRNFSARKNVLRLVEQLPEQRHIQLRLDRLRSAEPLV